MSDCEEQIAHYFDRLWPLLRSLSGEGVRRSHDILGELLPLERWEVPTGAKVLDWTVPKEWVVREAYVVGPDGRRVIDLADHTLHLLNYSIPFRGRMSRAELDQHLFSLPDQPDAIPYVTSYYAPRWGFCLTHAQRQALPEGEYEVVVDTDLIDGSITLSEAVLPGETDREVLFSTYTCHPSMANNELSGPLVVAFLYRRLAALPRRRYTYRFVFLPETLGSIAYLSRRGEHLRQKLDAGYVVTCVGDDAPFTYKYSRRRDSLADRAAVEVLRHLCPEARFRNFSPADGSDDRQYCSPGFNLPVGQLMRTMYAEFPQYHTSLDNRDFISFAALKGSVDAYAAVCEALEANRSFRNLSPYGEPQLGPRGLHSSRDTSVYNDPFVEAVLWVLNYSDGEHDLLGIAALSGYPMALIARAAERCAEAGLLAEIG